MKSNKCPICNNNSKLAFKHTVLKKYHVKYFYCRKCVFIFTESPYWLKEAYSEPITKQDIGLLSRNIKYSKVTTVLAYFLNNKSGDYLDYAGGYGVLTRLMKDLKFSFFHYDPYTPNVFAKDSEIKKLNKNQSFLLITGFELLEHINKPNDLFRKLSKHSSNLLFSTELLKSKEIDRSWWYFQFDHGQHISLYSITSLQTLAKQHNMFLYSNNKNIHFFSKQKRNWLQMKIIFSCWQYLYPIMRFLLKHQ